jgi:hypothetical protein
MPPSETKKIFILRNNDLGDVLLTTPFGSGLEEKFSRSEGLYGRGRLGEAIGRK